jgi:hypothetical protein
MKLKRPSISKGPWRAVKNRPEDDLKLNRVKDPDGWNVAFIPEGEHSYGEEDANAVAIAALPEVMDRLEWIHGLLLEEKSHPMTVHELEQTMLKMGYTKEDES